MYVRMWSAMASSHRVSTKPDVLHAVREDRLAMLTCCLTVW